MRQIEPLLLDEQLYGKSFGSQVDTPELRQIGNLFRALLRSKTLILAAAVLGGVAAYLIGTTLEPQYTSVARVMIDTRVEGARAAVLSDAELPTTVTALESELEVLRSLDLVERVVDELQLDRDPEFAALPGPAGVTPVARLLGDVRQRLAALGIPVWPEDERAAEAVEGVPHSTAVEAVAERLTVEKGSYMSAVYDVNFTSGDPAKAALIANTLVEQYLEMQVAAKIDHLDRSREWLTQRASDLNRKVAVLARELGVRELDAPFPTPESLTQAHLLRDTVMARLETARRQATTEESARQPGATEESAGQPGPTRAAAELATLHDINQRLMQQAAHDAEVKRLENEVTVAEGVYSQVVAQLTEMQEQGGFLRPDSRIVSHARPASNTTGPSNKRLVALGSVSAAFLAAFVVGLRELFERRLRSLEDFERMTNLPVLAFVPRSRERSSPLHSIARGAPTDVRLIKAARKLKASLAASGERQQVIAGASSLAGEGKSSTLLLLADTYARSGEKTLLLDLDFWRSPFVAWLGRRGPALRALMANPALLDSAVQAVPGIPLHILPAGKSSGEASELDELVGFQRFVSELRARYDRVIIDFPPVLPVVDLAPFAVHADATVLMVRWNATPRGAVRSAVRVLRDIGVAPIGVIATLVSAEKAHLFADDAFSYSHPRYYNGY
jgi:uncharacterized protein involved in exopolysaccharide biosynthesis/MinD-like ATPase involved in chromosome partitioning or flagellar assembly